MRRRAALPLSLAMTAACSGTSHPTPAPDGGHATDARPVVDARQDARRADASSAPEAGGARACTLAAPTPPDWRLVTDGQLLRDGLGRVVFLRGVDAGGRSKFAPYVPFDYPTGGYAAALDAYMAHAASWGIDAMRVPFTWAALEPTRTTPPTYDTAWLARYVALLQSAWQHGIYTVVDFHQDVYAEVFCGDGFPTWTLPGGGADAGPPVHDCPDWSLEYGTDTAVKAAFDAFWPASSPAMTAYFQAWDEMMSQVADTPGVIGFEPINEPDSGSANNDTFEPATLTPFFTAIAAEMNAKAPKALVFFDPTGIDGVTVSTTMTKPGGSNLVFAPHFYPLQHLTAAEIQDGLSGWVAYRSTWNVPVFVGEFGASNAQPGTLGYMQSVFASMDALGLSGTEWEYSVSVDLWNSESGSVATPDGGEYAVAQALIRPFARAVAGTGITQSYDLTSGTFTLSYTATDGITEVRVPPRAYPKSYGVTLTGACFDGSDAPGEVLLQASAGAPVRLTIAAKR